MFRSLILLAACSAPAAKPAPIVRAPVPVDAAVDATPVVEQSCGPSKIAQLEPDEHRIAGAICDARTHRWVADVVVIATAPQLSGTQTAITDEDGAFAITNLPEGDYLVTYYFNSDVIFEGHAATAAKPFVQMVAVP